MRDEREIYVLHIKLARIDSLSTDLVTNVSHNSQIFEILYIFTASSVVIYQLDQWSVIRLIYYLWRSSEKV